MSKIYITCDHAGFDLKNTIVEYLNSKGIAVQDLVVDFDKDDDYPDNAKLLALEIRKDLDVGQDSIGVAICGSGQGICIALNRFPFIRASLPRTIHEAQKTREHNRSNVLCLGSGVDYFNNILEIVTAFVNTQLGNTQRHIRRINKMDDVDFAKI